MATSAGWQYLIPTFYGTSYDTGGRRISRADMSVPRLGVFCPHSPESWLLGSFVVSSQIFEQRQEVYWGWSRTYGAADGSEIDFDRQRSASAVQEVVDDRPVDVNEYRDAISRAVRRFGPESPQVRQLADERTYALDNLRLKVKLKCGVCTLRRDYRSEKLHQVVSTIWANGVREIPFEVFIRSVERRANG